MTDLRTDLEALADEWGIPLAETSASASDAASDFVESINDSGTWRFVRDLQALLAKHSAPTADRDEVAEVIWTTSRADESTISATGANHVAVALLARFDIRRKA